MNESYFGRFSIPLLLVASVFAGSGCAGELTQTEKDNFLNENPTTTMAGGNGGAGGSGGSGMAEAGPGVDISCVKTFFEKKCTSCHGVEDLSVPDLSFSAANLTNPSKFIGIQAKGDGSEMACVDLKALWIDPANPDKSLIYTKLSNGACGSKMPATGGTVTANEKACVFSWVNSLIASSGGTTGAGTTGTGTTGTGTTRGAEPGSKWRRRSKWRRGNYQHRRGLELHDSRGRG